jgi:hypothetical protein
MDRPVSVEAHLRSTIRIGGASAFWGDSAVGPAQLVERGAINYLVFDYLAETTMAILASAKAKDSNMGYASDFVDTMRSLLPAIAAQRIKVVSNAGGLNPDGCAKALAAIVQEAKLSLKIAVVEGDDIKERLTLLHTLSMDGDQPVPVPQKPLSANVYFGALPVARALSAGADIVVTGRCVDSAVTLGPLLHEFGWRADDYDLLAAGSLAGHIIECGCQATGGLFTDWQLVPDWADIGYPIVECRANGQFTVSKPPNTGGLICAPAVAEQMLYEIGDPQRYLLPDVTCDFSQVSIQQDGPGKVQVAGARGSPPSPYYKVSATFRDGFRCSGTMIIIGIDAVAKARRTADAILTRTRRLLAQAGHSDFTGSNVEVIGAETLYGPHARYTSLREVMMRVTVTHPSKSALEIFAKEIAPSGTSWSPGTTMPPGGRPQPAPVIRQFNCLVPKTSVQSTVRIADETIVVPSPPGRPLQAATPTSESPTAVVAEGEPMPLIALAYSRSGDKGERSNIGVIARRAEFLPLIEAQLTASAVQRYFAHLGPGPVRRYALPGIQAFNYVIDDVLHGGGSASMRMDPMGKGMAQMLLDFQIRVPPKLVSQIKSRDGEGPLA